MTPTTPAPAKRCQQPEDEQRTGPDLRQAGEPGVHDAGAHAQALEPTGRPCDLSAPDDVIDAMGQEDRAEHQAGEEQRQADGRGRKAAE